MKFLRSHANGSDYHDESEERPATKKSFLYEKEATKSSDSPTDLSGSVIDHNPSKEMIESVSETTYTSDDIEHDGIKLVDCSYHSDDEEEPPDEDSQEHDHEEGFTKNQHDEPENSDSEVPDESMRMKGAATDTDLLPEEVHSAYADDSSEGLEDKYSVVGLSGDSPESYNSGNASLFYLRGLLYHQRMNLDDAIHYLGKCLELAVETDLFEYVVKSQIQLAAVCLKRYRIHGYEKDYYSALHYSENLIQIAKELELDELWTEALLLRAILRKVAKDVYGAREDLKQARAMAESTGQDSIASLIDHELQEVRRLVARVKRQKHHDEENGDSMMDEALEAIPVIFDESLKLEVSRESLEISVELTRLVIMNLSSGLPLYTFNFVGHANQKDDLVYGFLSALSHLAAEVMDSAGMIRSISHEGSTVMMEHRGAYMAALFSNREDFRARQSLQRFLREFLRLLPEIRPGEVMSDEYRMAADEMLKRIFKAYFLPTS